nr:hypothetical protein BgiMline_007742 [Biomphalaria glabrata]
MGSMGQVICFCVPELMSHDVMGRQDILALYQFGEIPERIQSPGTSLGFASVFLTEGISRYFSYGKYKLLDDGSPHKPETSRFGSQASCY